LRVASVVGVLALIGAFAVAALMGAYVPVELFRMVGEGRLDARAAGALSALSVIAGAVVAFFAIVVGLPTVSGLAFEGRGEPRELREKLTAYRARQRAMLEELDEVKRLLEEIRDLLKEGVGA